MGQQLVLIESEEHLVEAADTAIQNSPPPPPTTIVQNSAAAKAAVQNSATVGNSAPAARTNM